MRVVARGWGSCAPVRARVLAWSVLGPRWWRACGCVCGGPRLCARPPSGVLWRFPTLPHPLGCSTIGAAGLSFQVRNVAGRFPGAVTTTRLCVQHAPPLFVCVWGCGLIVVRIVVAAVDCSLRFCSTRTRGVGCCLVLAH